MCSCGSAAAVPWCRLVASMLAQRVASIESTHGWASLCRLLGGRAPGPIDLRLPPDPAALAARAPWWYHRLGIERHRADTLGRVGLHAARLEEAASMPLPDAHRRLRAVRGIGAWTAAEVAGPALGDADAVSIGDYHLPNIVRARALAGKARADDARMLKLLAPFAGQSREGHPPAGRRRPPGAKNGAPPSHPPHRRPLTHERRIESRIVAPDSNNP